MKRLAYKFIIAAVVILPLIVSSCIHDDFEEPPVTVIPEGEFLTLDQIYQIHTDSVLNEGVDFYKFTEDYSVIGIVIMDDKSGNIYKSAYIQDGTKGINLHMMSSGGLYQGDSIRINLKGLILSEYAGMMQIDSVDVHKNIVKLGVLHEVEPELITIDQITTGQYLAKVIRLDNVQFSDEDLGTTYAVGAPSYITENKTLVDENGQEVIVRTSGYASFADNEIPEGRGSIIAVVGKFNDDWQLFIRSTYEVNFDQRRFGDVDTVFYEGFSSAVNGVAIDFANWENIAVTGVLHWMGFDNGETQYAKIDGTGSESQTYLILPQQTMDNYFISFQSRAGNLQNAKLELVVSTNYDGVSSPSTATWTVIPANIATAPTTGYGNWTPSGSLDLTAFSGNAYVAFRYTAAATQKGVFLVDDIILYKE